MLKKLAPRSGSSVSTAATRELRAPEPHGRADRRAERGHQALLDPHRAARRAALGGRVGRARARARCAACRAADRSRSPPSPRRAGSGRRASAMLTKLTASALCSPDAVDFFFNVVTPGVIGDKHQVGAQQLVRIAHAAPGRRGRRRRRRWSRGHGDHQRGGEHAQLARAPVAREHAQRMSSRHRSARRRGARGDGSARRGSRRASP